MKAGDADALLQRLDESDDGTFGHFLARGLGLLYSGELPDRNNEASFGRVLAGLYEAGFTWSPRFGRCLYLLSATDPRLGIRIHPANLMGDSRLGRKCQLNGCIALGERLGWIDGQKAVLLSQPAVRRVEEHFGGRPFLLEIRDPQ